MTSLRDLLWPRTVAVIGASSDSAALSGRPLRIMRESGFPGSLFPVNPRHQQVDGLTAYPGIDSVPGPVDVALILVPKALVLDVLAQCATAGVRLAVVFSSGFAEEGGGGVELERRLRELAASTPMRIIGPNAEGFLNTAGRVAATFSPAVEANLDHEPSGGDHLAVVSQSGGIGFAIFDRGAAAGLGFDYVVSTGNEADVDVVDLTEELVGDPAVRVVLLVVEGFHSPQRFLKIAEQARAAGTSIVVAKLGSSPSGARAALSHTAHQAGSDLAYEAAFRSAGVYQARDDDELIDIGMLLARGRQADGRRVGIMTTSGGAGVWLTDACVDHGLAVPELSAPIQRELRGMMPSYGSPRNPVDLTADAIHGGGLVGALELLLATDEVHGVALITSLANPTGLIRHADRLGELLTNARKPVVLYSYTRPADVNTRLLAELGLPWFPTATRTARALALLADRAPASAGLPGGNGTTAASGQLLADLGLPVAAGNGAGSGVELTVRAIRDDEFGPIVVLPTGQSDGAPRHAVAGTFVSGSQDDALRAMDRLPGPVRTALSALDGGIDSLLEVLARATHAVSGAHGEIREVALRLRLGEREGGQVHVVDGSVVRDGDSSPPTAIDQVEPGGHQ
jgi:acyl-CoA synthetase (NDP forming)